MAVTRTLLLLLLVGVTTTASAADTAGGDFWDAWQAIVHEAQASQPHWMTPLVTVTPRLEQEVRYDQYHESLEDHGRLDRYGSGKGLELIPTTTNEVLINMPSYDVKNDFKKSAKGFNDWPLLTIKQRLLSADESHGNYILTAFLGFQEPTGVNAFTNHAWLITPTIAGGMGWGDFDVQATGGVAIPTRINDVIGSAASGNVALQYHCCRVLWPEFECNATHWVHGTRDGKNQVFLTPGIIFGRFPLFDNAIRAIVGAGYQFAAGPSPSTKPVVNPMYNHAWIGTARIAF